MKNDFTQILFLKRNLLPFGKILLVGIFLLLQLVVFAQQRSVSGTVWDKNNLPLAGVTVLVKGTNIGALTDANGKYALLNVPATGATLVFSFIGMQNQEVAVNLSNTIDIVLSESTILIDEVVVVGYGKQKKESIVGAITSVNSASLVKSGTQTVTNAISGKLSGVFTNQRSGEPGANQAEIVVRGLSSWNSSAPLVLVDGVDRDFKDLDPNEIENISVLKDASATAVFGARGANGVIVVTTKRGLLGKAKMDFTASYGLSKIATIPQFIDSYTTMSMLNVAYKNVKRFSELIPDNILQEYRHPSSQINSLRYPNVNWWKESTVPFSSTYNANFNIQGGTNFVKYFVSLGYNEDGSFFKQTDVGKDDTRYWFKRFNYRANADFSLTKSTTLSFNIGGETGIKNQPGNLNWSSTYATGPSKQPAYFPDWALKLVPDPDYPDATGIRFALNSIAEGQSSPYTQRNQGSFSRYVNSTLFTDLILNQKLDSFVKGLSAIGKVSFSTYYNDQDLTTSYSYPEYTLDYTKIGVPRVNPWTRSGQSSEVYLISPLSIGTGGLQTGYYTDLYYEGSLNYSNSFGKHNLTALALASRQQKNSGTDFPYYNAAFVGRLTYDYSMKYLLELNAGYTGSERFAPGNRYGFFPSAAVGWVISEENFFRTAVPWMNKLKLRYSDGLVGSDAASTRWLYISDYSVSGNFIYESAAANPNALWELAHKRDFGLEIGVFKNLFTFSVDLYDEQRSKMLVTPPGTPLIGNTFKDLNLGALKKHGLDVEMEFNKTTAYRLNYYFKVIMSLNENRIIVRNDAPYAPEYKKQAGKPLQAILGGTELLDNNFFTTVDDIHLHTTPISYENLVPGDYMFLDYKPDGVLNTDDAYPVKGNYYPPFTGSLSGGLSYKNFTFSFLLVGTLGKWVAPSNYFETEFTNGNWKVDASQMNYWTPTNPHPTHETMTITSFTTEKLDYVSRTIVDHYWRNSDYIRLKELYLGYQFYPASLKSFGIAGLQVYLAGYNLLTLTNLIRDVDPESMTTQSWTTGWYPQTYSAKLGLKVSF